jgi:hypothetical protein
MALALGLTTKPKNRLTQIAEQQTRKAKLHQQCFEQCWHQELRHMINIYFSDKTLYKYRQFNAQTLSMFINGELYFASPENLNDPYDCQISITESIRTAISAAKKQSLKPIPINKIELLSRLEDSSPKMETDIKGTGIFSMSKTSTNVLMWSHYTDEHRGLCVGFRLPDCLLNVSEDVNGKIVGTSQCAYFSNNPFVNYLVDVVTSEEPLAWDDFWFKIFGIGLVAKHNAWRYEKEIRIVRAGPGIERFSPKEITEIIFGLNMSLENRNTILRLTSASEWAHVKFKKMTKNCAGFNLTKTALTDLELSGYWK